jgi:polar amino acid transport system ATP-binding protein
LDNAWKNVLQHLEVNDVRASYGKLEVLSGIDFTLDKGEVVALVGPSGSGKSTVLRVLMGLTPPSAGTVSIDGEQIRYGSASSVAAARDRMAVVFQQYNLFQNMSVVRNVTLAPVKIKKWPRSEVEENARRLLAKVGLADKSDAYPDELSGGQQQRVAIARALALKPEILLLDEVTSALDPELVNEVLDTIRELAAEGMTMLIVSHEMAFVREVAARVIMMDHGKVIEVGPPDQILDAPETERAREFFSKILRH